MEKGTDSRQILVVDFSAAHFWLATGPVCFPVSDFLLFPADCAPANAVVVVDSAAGLVSVVDPAVKIAVDLACSVAAGLVYLAYPACRFSAVCFVAAVVPASFSLAPRSFSLRNHSCPSLLCFAVRA